jgi:hypothetical protein
LKPFIPAEAVLIFPKVTCESWEKLKRPICDSFSQFRAWGPFRQPLAPDCSQ